MARSEQEILAAGVVLLRGTNGSHEVCILHRPRHRDWSLPKGKLEIDEHAVTAARRETIEETGCDVALGVPLPTQEYKADGKPKTVYYWVGLPRKGGPGFDSNKEVDKISWVSPKEAAKRLTYPRDVDLVEMAVAAPATSPLVILRHTQATRRAQWKKPDDNTRPLAPLGNKQAKELVTILDAYNIKRIISSNAVRCMNTVRPFARSLDVDVSTESSLSELGFEKSPRQAMNRLNKFLADPTPTVVCSHRPVFPDLFAHIAKRVNINDDEFDPALPPGGFVVLHRAFDKHGRMSVVAVERQTI